MHGTKTACNPQVVGSPPVLGSSAGMPHLPATLSHYLNKSTISSDAGSTAGTRSQKSSIYLPEGGRFSEKLGGEREKGRGRGLNEKRKKKKRGLKEKGG